MTRSRSAVVAFASFMNTVIARCPALYGRKTIPVSLTDPPMVPDLCAMVVSAGSSPGMRAVPVWHSLRMSMISVAREDKKEKLFVEMLRRSQSDSLADDEPVVFAVFGRGRVLCAFSGREINAGNLEDAAKFLAGPCSCQVKELNPGVDLLMGADWESVVDERPAVAALVGRIEVPEPKIANGPAKVEEGAMRVRAVSSVRSSDGMRMIILKIGIVGAGIAVMVLGALLLMRQRGEGR